MAVQPVLLDATSTMLQKGHVLLGAKTPGVKYLLSFLELVVALPPGPALQPFLLLLCWNLSTIECACHLLGPDPLLSVKTSWRSAPPASPGPWMQVWC
jgi:hypothetical protein